MIIKITPKSLNMIAKIIPNIQTIIAKLSCLGSLV
jgi:hypothetical protein